MKYRLIKEYEIVSLYNIFSSKIRSVKRLSDGEVFSVGDEIYIGMDSEALYIKEIEIFGENTVAIGVHSDEVWAEEARYALSRLNKANKKKPLFTSEDGVYVFKGDPVYEVDKKWRVFTYSSWKSYYGNKGVPKKDTLMFSTRSAAKEYIVMEKPCLSLSEVMCACPLAFSHILEEKVKSKIENENT